MDWQKSYAYIRLYPFQLSIVHDMTWVQAYSKIILVFHIVQVQPIIHFVIPTIEEHI